MFVYTQYFCNFLHLPQPGNIHPEVGVRDKCKMRRINETANLLTKRIEDLCARKLCTKGGSKEEPAEGDEGLEDEMEKEAVGEMEQSTSGCFLEKEQLSKTSVMLASNGIYMSAPEGLTMVQLSKDLFKTLSCEEVFRREGNISDFRTPGIICNI